MTAKATKVSTAPPITATTGAETKTGKTPTDDAELRRWSPEEVIAKRWLPYRSARVLKEKCYRRLVIHHNDGGRITFTAEDIRRENARTVAEPLAA